MQLFVGLGNPGAKYAGHRHNIGFMVLDALAEAEHANKWSKKFSGELTEISVEGEKILLLKPQTYMNNSGRSVQAAMAFYKLKPEQITVFHDELDIALGEVRVKIGGGHAGHNGLRDIDAHIGKEYRRVRIGIDHPGEKHAVSGYVLHDFSKAEHTVIAPLIDDLIHYISLLVSGDNTEFSNKLTK